MTEPRRTANRHPELSAAVRAVISTHALRDDARSVITCRPGPVELAIHPTGKREWVGNTGKVCYPDKVAADTAAGELNDIPGADRVMTYACPRGGHWHHRSEARDRAAWEAAVCRMWLAVQRGKVYDAARAAQDAA